MAVFGKQSDHLHAKHLNPETVSFSMFTNDDIKKLCVTRIYTPLTFDSLGFPLPGGLHDKTLGPLSEKGDPCATCLKNSFHCPGHYGYIELPMPVVNPLFHKIISVLLKKSCLHCFKVQVPEYIKHIISLQMKLLDMGRISEALQIEVRVMELVGKYERFDNIPEEDLDTLQIDDFKSSEIDGEIAFNKSTELLKNQFIKNIFDSIKSNKSCLYCKISHDKITSVKNKLFITTRQNLEKNTSNDVRALLTKHINPEDSRSYLRSLWKNDSELLRQIIPLLNGIDCEYPTDVFYMDIIPVTPTNVRPVNMVAGRMSEHFQTKLYKTILQDALLLRAVIKVVQQKGDCEVLSDEAKAAYKLVKGDMPIEKLNNTWENLQNTTNGLIDRDSKANGGEQGLKQIIEKKEGIIRKHMMGKRVNFAARSVITPDPNLNIEEIGIPEAFAMHLTYPVPVTSWNVEELRKMIMNGPNVHPGAITVEFEDGMVNRINPKDATQQESILKRLLTPDGPDKGFRGVKMVHRHLCNGDVLLLNRQPSLHKPSIMAHTARVLKGEKTLRLHYANCKAYNADFDGDEMNAHFPQNELSRSEAYTIANVSNQYLVPKDGTPLSGLIQDHMISGVKLSIRGKFFSRIDYQQLVYQGLSFKLSRIKLLPPAIMKPRCLWSGKQILSTVILNIIPTGKVPINLLATSKISSKAWQTAEPRAWKAGGTAFVDQNIMTEAEVVIRHGELLVGILDKSHYGATPYSLVHCMYELYGGSCAIKLLSSLAKLFTCFLQMEGFTLGVHDILVLAEADKKRVEIIKNSRAIGDEVITQALNIPADSTSVTIVEKLEEQSASNIKMRAIIDRQYKTSLDSYTNDINKTCIPAGLICKFPDNNLQLMVQSGAKGSTVNTMQISCALGQIELEGKRPPVMISGKSLPSFPKHEFAPRAGGFIDGRFMTGIQPQEFFFHCMAGREGLIDTAVKTSRSGYLQRCLIKHLEGLRVGYDMTVRDSDRSVVQFCYGEDGMDISKVQFLNKEQFPFLADNYEAVVDQKVVEALLDPEEQSLLAQHSKVLKDWRKKNNWDGISCIPSPFSLFSMKVKDKVVLKDGGKLNSKTGRDKKTKFICELWQQSDDIIKRNFTTISEPCPEPLVSKFQPDCYYGSLNERLAALVEDYSGGVKHPKRMKKLMTKLINLKAMQSLCAPGEPVGLLAAQSIGEPSTQMTLNTFHFAGRGEMNVTLGIPRLREILMVASKNIKTPSMEVPFLKVPQLEAKAEKLRKILTRVVVADILEKIDVQQEMIFQPERKEKITLRFHFMPYHLYKNEYNLKPSKILKYMSDKFFKLMFLAVQKYAKVHINVVSLEDDRKKRHDATEKDNDDDLDDPPEKSGGHENVDDASSDDEAPEDPDNAKDGTRYNQLCDDQAPEIEEEPDEANLSDKEDEVKEPKNTEDEDLGELSAKEINSIQTTVLQTHQHAHSFTFDTTNYSWCELSFFLPISSRNIDMTAILKDTASKAVLWETVGIRRAIVYENNGQLMLKTDGINMVEMFKYNRLLDLSKLYSNDIHKIVDTYGIEAAMRVIVREVRDVFKVYGITVDPRHLLLIADYMTFSGQFEPLNRKGMESSSSPLHQLSFESSLAFLKAAAIRGKMDKLETPSSCLMIGKPCNTGTGSFTLLQKIQTASV